MNTNIENIERYLSGEMLPEEKVQFETELSQNTDLQLQLEQVRTIKESIKTKAIKEHITKAFKSYKTMKIIKLALITTAVIAVVVAASYWFIKSQNHEFQSNATTTVADSLAFAKANETQLLSSELEVQYLSVNNETDNIIESRGGMLIAIPANALVDENGKTIKGKVTYAFQEATKAEDIILAGLNTTSEGKLLETGGMFQIAAYQNDKTLQIDPKHKITVKVPTHDAKPEMQLFEGKRLKNGVIDWVNPKPLVKDLSPVDILELDFYPPNYIEALNKLHLYRNDKTYLDSLYYSFSGKVDLIEGESKLDTIIYPRIEPASIKTIWNRKFNNTLLATKEFEERLKYLHSTCRNQALELYINNLDKNMYEIDEMVAKMFSGNHKEKFENFAAQKLGKVKGSSAISKLLAKYYKLKKARNKEILEKTYASFSKKQKAMQTDLEKLKTKGSEIRQEQLTKLLEEEIKFNTASVYKQLGLKPCETVEATAYYTAEISNFNTYNIDAFVMDVSSNRKSGTYSFDGKTAKVEYNIFEVYSKQMEKFDKNIVYFIQKDMNVYINAEKKLEKYEAQLNADIFYRVLCIGILNNQYYYFRSLTHGTFEEEIIPDYTKISKDSLKKIIKYTVSSKSEIPKLWEDFENQSNTLNLEQQIEKTRIQQQDIDHLEGMLFPCKEIKGCLEIQNEVLNGKELFDNNCSSCHSTYKIMVGPSLGGVTQRRNIEWIINWVKNPAKIIASRDKYAVKLATEYKSAGIMSGFAGLKDEDIRNIIAYINCTEEKTDTTNKFALFPVEQ
jgi:cytochrome c2